MKLSAYRKSMGNATTLKLDYDNLQDFDKVFISKVFTDTQVPDGVLNLLNVEYGGTGFFYDKAPPLPYEIEHIMPDYHLYDEWVEQRILEGIKPKELTYYTDYSIGFLTRGCFRGCEFCVNKNCKQALVASPIKEFLDVSRPKVCLQDDNFFACSDWKTILYDLKQTGKKFQFKQGLDERLLTKDKINELFSCNTEGDLIFAFDNIEDEKVIVEKLELIKVLFPDNKKTMKFYTFVGFDRNNNWDLDFWKQDIEDCFKRIAILMEFRCIPYLTRFNRYVESPYRGMYIDLARWCNQPNFFKKKSFREFCEANGKESACYKYIKAFEEIYPEIGKKYFDMKFENA